MLAQKMSLTLNLRHELEGILLNLMSYVDEFANKPQFWINFGKVSYRSVFATPLSEAMSRDSMVTSLPSRSWSCSTLQEGVQACAQIAGLKLKQDDVQQASLQPVHGRVQHAHVAHVPISKHLVQN